MDTDLMNLVNAMGDEEAMKLAVVVKDELDSDRGEAALAGLTPDGARTFLKSLELIAAERTAEDARERAGWRAREFLVALVELDAFNPIIAQKLVDAGVRLSAQDLVEWFSGKFNLASLLGIRFEYEGEKIDITETDTGSIETRRTIKLSIGTKSG